MAVTLTFDAHLSRVRIEADDLGTADYATVERSTDQIRWQFVRGGRNVELAGTELARPLDDYEWPPDVEVFYRVRSWGSGDQVEEEHTESVTPTLEGRIWLKSIVRPFLNRPITVTDWSDVTRRARNGVFEVVGRSVPVAVTDLRSSRQFTLVVVTSTPAEADEFDLILASGDPIFLHMPPDCPVPGASGHYAVIGDTLMERRSTRGPRRYFHLPLTEAAPPDPDVVGVTYTWQSALNDYATWADLDADNDTWNDLLEQVGSVGDVIVG